MAPKILLIQLRQLGDILLTTPCIREIKRAWPEAELSFLAHPMGRLVLGDNPYLKELLCYQETLAEQWQILRRIRAQRYDLVLDFMYNPRSALYARASGAPRRLAFKSRRSFLFTETVPQSSAVEYIVNEKFRYLQQLGISPQSVGLDLPWFAAQVQVVEEFLQREKRVAEAPLRVVLSPTHRRLERQWPLARFAALADRLSREWQAAVIWVWGPGEEDLVAGARSLCQLPSSMAPKTSFRELAALISNCDLFIGNSNGPSHVAVAVDTPSLQLHGFTYAATWCPLSARHRAVQAGANLPEGRGPITLISGEELWQALDQMHPMALAAARARETVSIKRKWQSLL